MDDQHNRWIMLNKSGFWDFQINGEIERGSPPCRIAFVEFWTATNQYRCCFFFWFCECIVELVVIGCAMNREWERVDTLQVVINLYESVSHPFRKVHTWKLLLVSEECISMVMSRLLGLGITLGSLIIFIPQILKIQSAQSGEGISLLSQVLDCLPVLQ